MRLLYAAALAVMLLFAHPAFARDWPKTAGWDVIEGDDYCSIHMEFEGKGATELSLLLKTDNDIVLGMSNSGWSIADDQQEDLTFGVNGTVFSGGKSVGIGDVGGKKAFVTSFESDFLQNFAASSYLIVRKGDVLVDNLSLKGSAAALVVAKRCLALLKRDIAAAAAEKRRFDNIADDPFAKKDAGGSATAGIGGAKSDDAPVPLVSPTNWFPFDSYPAAAKRAGAQGRASWEVDVDEGGRATACRITASTGNADLDATTCRLALRNGRFKIGVAGKYRGSANWTLNDE
ncbi:TonB family protein [Sphingomonas panacisoli]|nr:TonB family protein [Sphingomonas panacisoli]